MKISSNVNAQIDYNQEEGKRRRRRGRERKKKPGRRGGGPSRGRKQGSDQSFLAGLGALWTG